MPVADPLHVSQMQTTALLSLLDGFSAELVVLHVQPDRLSFANEFQKGAVIVAPTMAAKLGMPIVDLRAVEVDFRAVKLVPKELINEYQCLPLWQRGDTLYVTLSFRPKWAHGGHDGIVELCHQIRLQTGANIEHLLSMQGDISNAIKQVLNVVYTSSAQRRAVISRWLKTVLPETIRGRVEIRAGDAGEEILKVAQDFGIDLIAFPLSAARPGGPWPMVSNVISRVCCPVVILPPRLVGH